MNRKVNIRIDIDETCKEPQVIIKTDKKRSLLTNWQILLKEAYLMRILQ